MRKYLLLLASIAVSFTACPAAFADSECDGFAGNVLSNCGFETGDFTSWVRIDSSNFTGVDSHNPNSGSYAANLGADGVQGSLSQTFTTSASSYYQLSFFLENEIATDISGNPDPGLNMISVVLTNSSGASTTLMAPVSIAESSAYASYQYFFYGSGSDTISFVYENDPSYFDLDDVIVSDPAAPGSPVPEPSSLALLGTGVLGCAGFLRSRSRAKRALHTGVSGQL